MRVAINMIACIFCVFPLSINAQVCNYPSGEVLINQSFSTAGSPISIADFTSYEFEPISCPGDGQYAVLNSVDGTCFNSTWHNLPGDHTTSNGTGNMLVVNGGNKPGTFYQQPVSYLCRGTNYEISFWVVNLLRPNTCSEALIPNLSINVETKDGVLIQSTAIGLIDQTETPTWRRYSTLFTVPVTTDEVIIKLVNHQGDYGCGNDMAIDDIQLKPCGECAAPPEIVYVPDAFTPNNDGVNDTLAFFLRASAANSYSVKIFNRWGNPVFTSQNAAEQWDGTFGGMPCPAGPYTWIITRQSSASTRNKQIQTGRVLLIR
ncbi:hypothetical protein GCM10028805_20410 [Spirosoma harenae]